MNLNKMQNDENKNTNLVTKYNFSDGILFFKEIFGLFKTNYRRVFTLTFMMIIASVFLAIIPLINIIFFTIISLMYIYGIHLQLNSKEIIFSFQKLENFKLLKTPFNKENIFTLIAYSVFSICVNLIIYAFSNFVKTPNLGILLLFLVFVIIILASQYFAPLLILQQKMKVFKALFFSLFTCYYQWKALCSFYLILSLVIILPFVIFFILIAGFSNELLKIVLLFIIIYYLFLMLFFTYLSQYYLYTKFFANSFTNNFTNNYN